MNKKPRKETKETEENEIKEQNLRDKVNSNIINKFGNTALPTTIVGTLDTGWIAFDRFCPIELGTSVLLWGPSQSAKSLIMMKLGASVQDKGGLFVCFNTEAANRDSEHLKRVVPNLKYEDILFYQPDYVEHIIDSIGDIIDITPIESAPVFIAIDSISSCSPKSEQEAKEFKSKAMVGAEIAQIWSQALRKLTNKLSKKPIVLCLVSQERTGGIGSFMTRKVSGGGDAPYFYASTALKTRAKTPLYKNKDGEPILKDPIHPLQEKAAQECSMKLQKSRYSSGGSKLEYIIDFEKGIDRCESLISMLLYKNIISKSGSWYNYGDISLGQGENKAKKFLIENESILNELIEKLKNT